ncbi:MAG TPA: hypothetical protein VEB63_10535 [Chitinophagaceae bacterium]|nr:hypothetical protein [Chitinophagaceae bacterium]
MKRFGAFLLLPLISSFVLISCSEKETIEPGNLAEFIPTLSGKYITYRVDSMVFTNFGRNTEIRKYQMKYVVDSQLTDIAGRKFFRVFRYIRDSAGTQPWVPIPSSEYTITPLFDQVEINENNLRVIKLHLPLADGNTWKGNKYLPNNPYSGYNFSNDDNMADWDFFIDGELSTFSYQNRNYADVLTVEQADEIINVPITDPNAYAARTRSVERYAKNIGLVYRELELWEYQPNTGGSGGPYKTGFGVKMWMIDHN